MKRGIFRATVLVLGAVLGSGTTLMAGAVNGPRKDCLKVSGETYHTLIIWFVGNEEARVTLIGDGKADLDLYVYDQSGKQVACDEDATATCLVSWTPSQTASYTIKIVNRGQAESSYCLTSN
ncbi:MAG TPA: hypothetical protein VEF04_09770 [Blastocatellia bacterium]|nr:hypothetical protein [Blastocatellia bacterium]